jgi:hypothetical protein
MSVNKYKPHVLVLPEDDANRQMANGFLLHPALNPTCIDVQPHPGGWGKVLDTFERVHVAGLRSYPKRHLVLLIDFDEQVSDRTQHVRDRIPADVSDRVYLLGTHGEPEPLKSAQGCSLERIGEDLASACADGVPGLWQHALLTHNQAELDRLIAQVKPFLFSP